MNALNSPAMLSLRVGTPKEHAELVPEDAALEHFQLSLKGLVLPEGILTLADEPVSQWDVYTQHYGEYAGRLTLNDSVSGIYEEWGGCDGEGAREWIGTRARAESLCGGSDRWDVTWQMNNGTFTINTGEFEDTCTVISGDRNRFSASCDITLESGSQIEIQYFVRTGINRFNEDLLVGDFAEFSSGSHKRGENSYLSLSADLSGRYEILGDPGESGNFSWSLADNASELLLDVEGESGPVPPPDFLGYYAGAFHTFDQEDQEAMVMIPDYRPWRSVFENESVYRYRLPEGTPKWDGADPGNFAYTDPEQSDTGEVFVAEALGQPEACRVLHRIAPTRSGRVYWMDCSRLDGSGDLSFELWRFPNEIARASDLYDERLLLDDNTVGFQRFDVTGTDYVQFARNPLQGELIISPNSCRLEEFVESYSGDCTVQGGLISVTFDDGGKSVEGTVAGTAFTLATPIGFDGDEYVTAHLSGNASGNAVVAVPAGTYSLSGDEAVLNYSTEIQAYTDYGRYSVSGTLTITESGGCSAETTEWDWDESICVLEGNRITVGGGDYTGTIGPACQLPLGHSCSGSLDQQLHGVSIIVIDGAAQPMFNVQMACPVVEEFRAQKLRLFAGKLIERVVESPWFFQGKFRTPGTEVHEIVHVLAVLIIIDVHFGAVVNLPGIVIHDQKPCRTGIRGFDQAFQKPIPAAGIQFCSRETLHDDWQSPRVFLCRPSLVHPESCPNI